jgi:hypothetical protein
MVHVDILVFPLAWEGRSDAFRFELSSLFDSQL